MFNKILIALSVLLMAQLGSATMITPDQLATSFTAAGLVTEVGYTDTGGYKVLVTDLIQGTDLSPNQAFAIATTLVVKLMVADDNHYAVSVVGVSTTDGKIRYLEVNQDMAESIGASIDNPDEAAGTILGMVLAFNGLPTLG